MRQDGAVKKDSFALHHMAKQALASKSFMKEGIIPEEHPFPSRYALTRFRWYTRVLLSSRV